MIDMEMNTLTMPISFQFFLLMSFWFSYEHYNFSNVISCSRVWTSGNPRDIPHPSSPTAAKRHYSKPHPRQRHQRQQRAVAQEEEEEGVVIQTRRNSDSSRTRRLCCALKNHLMTSTVGASEAARVLGQVLRSFLGYIYYQRKVVSKQFMIFQETPLCPQNSPHTSIIKPLAQCYQDIRYWRKVVSKQFMAILNLASGDNDLENHPTSSAVRGRLS